MTLEQTKLNNLLSSGGGGGRGNNKNTETQNKTLAPRESVLLPLDPQMVPLGVSVNKTLPFPLSPMMKFFQHKQAVST